VRGLFYEGRPSPAREPDPAGRAVTEFGGEVVAAAADGLRVQPGDGRDHVEPAVPEPLGLGGRDPPPLLLVEPAEDQVEAAVMLGVRAGAGSAVVTRALVDGAFHAGTSSGTGGRLLQRPENAEVISDGS
jgi:hypothetical protein